MLVVVTLFSTTSEFLNPINPIIMCKTAFISHNKPTIKPIIPATPRVNNPILIIILKLYGQRKKKFKTYTI